MKNMKREIERVMGRIETNVFIHEVDRKNWQYIKEEIKYKIDLNDYEGFYVSNPIEFMIKRELAIWTELKPLYN